MNKQQVLRKKFVFCEQHTGIVFKLEKHIIAIFSLYYKHSFSPGKALCKEALPPLRISKVARMRNAELTDSAERVLKKYCQTPIILFMCYNFLLIRSLPRTLNCHSFISIDNDLPLKPQDSFCKVAGLQTNNFLLKVTI